jgi:hypothetical protein
MSSSVRPSILMSIWIEVTPSRVPATLKSMSPSASSTPRMSVSTATRSPSLISPIATPAQAERIGTPQSIIASEPEQTVAIELEPFDSRMSETMRIVYGNSSYGGSSAASARSASAPWPISRRLVPRTGFASPVEKGGKL